MSAEPRVLLATADAPTRTGIRLALEREALPICAEAAGAQEALALAQRERPDVCLVDKALPGGGVEAVRALRAALPAVKLIVISRDAGEDDEMLEAVVAGASGFLTTDVDPARLGWIVRGVQAGEAVLSRRMTHRLLEALQSRQRGRDLPVRPGAAPLTDREIEVLEHLAEGRTTAQVAARLRISDTTVRRHVSAAVDKLGVAGRGAAVALLRKRSSR